MLLRNHRLHIELHIDPAHEIGKLSRAGVRDIVIEAAITTIEDCEDAVSGRRTPRTRHGCTATGSD